MQGSEETAAGSGNVVAPMHGKLISIDVELGQTVNKGQRLAVLEAMKMQNEIGAPGDGVVKALHAAAGAAVGAGDKLVTLSAPESE